MRNFQDTFETSKRSFTSAFSICMTVPLMKKVLVLTVIISLYFSETKKNQAFIYVALAKHC